MITLKTLTLRNFLSTGAVTQSIKLDSDTLTLIIGENLDLGGAGSKNGVGKTTMIQALSYVLFGSPLNNIRKDNLINRTNAKNMIVTLDFSNKGIQYRIERGRKPNVLRFFINDTKLEEEDTAQGENKFTQLAIEQSIGMTLDMFKHIIALNTYSTPFLGMGSGEQRKIIEQLLGITLLSEKSEAIKAKMKLNTDLIQQEDFRNKTIEEANKRVQEQIESLHRRQRLWKAKHSEDLSTLAVSYDDLSKIDIDVELKSHKDLTVYIEKKRVNDACNALVARQIAWKQKRDKDVTALQSKYDTMSHIDITTELQSHVDVAEWRHKKTLIDTLTVTKTNIDRNIVKENNIITKLQAEIETLESNRCYACGQDFHDENHVNVLEGKKTLLANTQHDFDQNQIELEKIKNELLNLELGKIPETHYKTEAEAIKHSSELENIQSQVDAKKNEVDPYADQINEQCTNEEIGLRPVTHYDTEAEAIEHRSIVASLLQQIERKSAEIDPYSEQIEDMESKALQEVSFEKINELTKYGDHLKFLLDLLTSKDSFVRKKIMDQNLAYLNARLTHYLEEIGLPHSVVFKNDLSVEITELGRDLDFYNLSRGEMNRVILSLSFAFRDVWENLYSPINTIFIDELIDSGMDSVGVDNSLSILKSMTRNRNKSVWLVSHRDELVNRVDSVLKVIKEGGFTSYETSVEEIV